MCEEWETEDPPEERNDWDMEQQEDFDEDPEELIHHRLDDWDSEQWEWLFHVTTPHKTEEIEWDVTWEYDELLQLDLLAEQEEWDQQRAIGKARAAREAARHNEEILRRAKQRRTQRWKQHQQQEKERKAKEPLTYRQCVIFLCIMFILWGLSYC